MDKVTTYSKKMLDQAAKQFKAQGSIRLIDFLSKGALRDFERCEWTRNYDPLKNRYHWAKLPSFVFSPGLFEAMGTIVGSRVSSKSLICAAFTQGDYSVLRDDLSAMKGIVMLLDVTDMKEEWGGYSVFLRGSEEVFRVVPTKNTLTLIESKDMREFVKYVNHHAKNDRIVIAGVLKRND